MAEVMLWDPMDRFLWGIAITVLFITILQYFRKGKQKEIFKERILMYGFAGFLLGFFLSSIFTYLIDLLLPGTFRNGVFYGEYPDPAQLFFVPKYILIISLCVNLSLILSYLLLFIAFEIGIRRTKYLFSIITFIYSIFLMIFYINYILFGDYFEILILLSPIFNYFTSILLAYILYYATKWTRFEFKAVSMLLLLGYYNIVNGIAYASIKFFGLTPLFLPPILVIIGAIITLSPTFLNPRFFSQKSSFWKIIGISVISYYFLDLFYALYIGIPIDYLGTLFSFISLFLLIYFIMRNIKSEISLELKGKIKEKIPDILGMFTKPQRITEEEVSVSKEKKICLVCKGKVMRNNIYLCPECDTFYCKKCSSILITLENMCWYCNAPIDPLKTVKPYKEGVEEISLKKKASEKIHKNDNIN